MTTTVPAAPTVAALGGGARGGVGESVPRVDAIPKVTGTFGYASDMRADGMLWGAVLRSPHPSARILGVDVTAAAALPGVHAVLLAADLPGKRTFGLNFDDQPVLAGAANLRKQLENVRVHGVTPVVAINAFPTDYASEHDAIREVADGMGIRSAVCTHVADGGRGATELAGAVAEAAAEPSAFELLYPDQASLRAKIETVAQRVYGAAGVSYSPQAAKQLDTYERAGFGRLPVCIAKTHLSISSDPALKGAPTGWTLPVREVRASVGAGFVYPICGDMRTMPGLSAHPAAAGIDLDEHGEIVGLS